MNRFVECWHCKNYDWVSVNDDNLFAYCAIKNQCVSAKEKVCEQFILRKGIYTHKAIPEYCINYNNKTRT